jgi:hypothetical protein
VGSYKILVLCDWSNWLDKHLHKHIHQMKSSHMISLPIRPQTLERAQYSSFFGAGEEREEEEEELKVCFSLITRCLLNFCI